MAQMKLSSPAFVPNGAIPQKFSCDGDNVNPRLVMEKIPVEAKCLVLIMDDPDAPAGTWVHWVLWNVDPRTTEIAENSIPAESMQGANSWGKTGYGGPCPPSGTHRYYFRLFALNELLTLPQTADRKAVDRAMQGKILDRCELMGTYRRQVRAQQP